MTRRHAEQRLTARLHSGLVRLRATASRLRRRTEQFTAGGTWTDQLDAPTRHNLRALWTDGLFSNTSEQIMMAYLALFLLELGATRGQIGLMSSLSSLSAALVMLPGAILVERWGRRRQIVLFTGAGAARITLLLMALVPLLLSGPLAIYGIIALAVLRTALGNLGVPAWLSLVADVVPLSGRGRFFSTRNMAMGLLGMVTILLVGQLITGVGGSAGYQLAIGVAVVAGLLATLNFARIDEPPIRAAAPPNGNGTRVKIPFLRHLRRHPQFLAFCAAAAVWSFALQIAGPFFNPYLRENLGASASMVGTLGVISSLAALPGQRLFGGLLDRWGARRVQLVTGLLIPVVPLAWVFTRSPWHAAPLHLAGGFLWAGYNLANLNLLLTMTPEDLRPRYSALHQVVVTVAFAGGAAIGGLIAEQWGYHTAFVLSAIGRLTGALLFARLVRQPDDPSATTPAPAEANG